MGLTLITGPTVEPLTLAEARDQLRIDGEDEDTLLAGLIQAAREWAEAFTRRALITQTWELVLNTWPTGDRFSLPLPPLQSVTSIKYTDIDGDEATFSSASYIADTDHTPGRIVLKNGYSWPAVTLREVSGIRVRFVAGYGAAAADTPQVIRQAMLLVVGHLYENREDTVATGNLRTIPLGAEMLAWNRRVMAF